MLKILYKFTIGFVYKMKENLFVEIVRSNLRNTVLLILDYNNIENRINRSQINFYF